MSSDQDMLSNTKQSSNESIKTVTSSRGNEDSAWVYSFAATMAPFIGVCYAHQRGLTVKVLESVARSPVGVYGFFVLPFMTLGMEKVRERTSTIDNN